MEYKLIRQKRKTLSVRVADGAVTVKAPKSVSLDYIEKFVEQKSAWIRKKLDEQAKNSEALGGVCDYKKALYRGATLDIVVSAAHKRIAVDENALYVPQKFALKKDKIAAVGRWYKREAAKSLSERLNALSQATGLKYNSFALTNAKTKWGSCDEKCNIRLNWRLMMLAQNLVDYVVIHELAHTLHHDHSKAFWETVGKFYPDFKAARKSLKGFSAVTSLYR